MKPTIEGFEVIATSNGYGVTTIYDLFNLNKPTLLREFPTWSEAVDHKQRCYLAALSEYARCQDMGCSFPYND